VGIIARKSAQHNRCRGKSHHGLNLSLRFEARGCSEDIAKKKKGKSHIGKGKEEGKGKPGKGKRRQV